MYRALTGRTTYDVWVWVSVCFGLLACGCLCGAAWVCVGVGVGVWGDVGVSVCGVSLLVSGSVSMDHESGLCEDS